MTKPLMAKAKVGSTAMQKTLEQNLREAVIYENKPRQEARGRSPTTASEGCKKI